MIALSAPASAMGVYVGGRPDALPNVPLPPNMTFPDFFRPILESMLQRSPTFRRQCLRIANASGLLVRIRNVAPTPEGGSRARTQITSTDSGRMIANVDIKPLNSLTELIAHELEHVIEQLDGVDYPARAALPNTGVRQCADGTYETTRAARIGVMVAREARGE